ncbi:CarD family transcriptional regulator [Synergistaceae bacterium OttesenSCG-928-I11]|nr:CarD family transcriptional regulator [Synergistaceae bacterium OttesenSCG-928-I11]
MYKVGDLLVYESANCICRVSDIAEFDFQAPAKSATGSSDGAVKKRLYYVLKPLHENCTLYNPVDNTDVLMRPVISREEAERLIDTIPEMDALETNAGGTHFQEAKQIAQHYDSIIKTRDCETLIKLTRSIYEKKQSRARQNMNIGSVESTTLKKAEEMLFDEFSVALGIPRTDVQQYIEERLNGKTGCTHSEPRQIQ